MGLKNPQFHDLQDIIQLLREQHVLSLDSLKESFRAFVVARADVTSACSAAEADDSGDSFSWLIDILRHQPFTPNYASTTSPDIANLSSLLAEQPESEQTEFLLLILKVLRILSRKPANRQKVAEGDVAAIVRHLTGASRAVAGECANVILNLCFERANVSRLLKCNGVAPLVSLLKSPDTDVQASTCGVIQSICYLGRGRQATRDCAAIPELLALLGSGNGRVHARAVGALHNLSADPQSVRMTRRSNGIAPLTALLKCADMGTCAAAAGTLQNLAREAASRQLIRQQRAVPLLAALLSAPDLQAQLCATGALLNILGPVLERSPRAAAQRKALGSLLSCVLTLSMVDQCAFTQTAPAVV